MHWLPAAMQSTAAGRGRQAEGGRQPRPHAQPALPRRRRLPLLLLLLPPAAARLLAGALPHAEVHGQPLAALGGRLVAKPGAPRRAQLVLFGPAGTGPTQQQALQSRRAAVYNLTCTFRRSPRGLRGRRHASRATACCSGKGRRQARAGGNREQRRATWASWARPTPSLCRCSCAVEQTAETKRQRQRLAFPAHSQRQRSP